MDWASKDLVGLVYRLLPGFIAAWIFYGFTPHPKKDTFDRVVQALIFTVIVQVIVICLRWLFILIGSAGYSLGPWTENVALVWSVVLAVPLGIMVARAANNNSVGWLRNLTGSKRTTYPTEWYSAFHKYTRYVVLHLKDGRRLRGWPEEFPDACDKGHFVIDQPSWAMDDGSCVPLGQIGRTLVQAADVQMVEFEKNADERTETPEQIAEAQKPLLELHKEKSDGRSIVVP